MERIANERLSFSLSADGRQFELGFAGEAATLSGERGLFDMLPALRNRWPELLMTGKSVDEEFFTFDRQPFMVKGYVGGGRAAIVAWNITAHEHRFAPTLHAQRRFVEGASVGGPFRPGDLLPAHSVGVLVYD